MLVFARKALPARRPALLSILKTEYPLCGWKSMASASPHLNVDDVAWVKAHAGEVAQTFGAEFVAATDRFAQGRLLLDRFNAAIDSVLKNCRGYFSAVG